MSESPKLSGLALFEYVEKHLLTQGERAEDGSLRTCAYRVDMGTHILSCAAGCLIKVENYSPGFEGVTLTDSRRPWVLSDTPNQTRIWEAIEKSGVDISPPNKRIIRSLQEIHDDKSPSNWSTKLKALKAKLFPEIPTT